MHCLDCQVVMERDGCYCDACKIEVDLEFWQSRLQHMIAMLRRDDLEPDIRAWFLSSKKEVHEKVRRLQQCR